MRSFIETERTGDYYTSVRTFPDETATIAVGNVVRSIIFEQKRAQRAERERKKAARKAARDRRAASDPTRQRILELNQKISSYSAERQMLGDSRFRELIKPFTSELSALARSPGR